MRTLSRFTTLAALLAAASVSLVATTTKAAVIFHDGFDYTMGADVSGQGNWGGSPDWSGNFASKVVTGLTYSGLAVTGGAASVYEGGLQNQVALPSEFYFSALVNKTNNSGTLGITFRSTWNGGYLANLAISGDTLVAGNGGTLPWSFTGNSGSEVTTGATALLVAHIDEVNQLITAWDYGNPTNTVSYNLSGSDPLSYIEYYANFGAAGTVDEFTVGETLADVTPASVPEPASLGLLGAGALMLLRRRRA